MSRLAFSRLKIMLPWISIHQAVRTLVGLAVFVLIPNQKLQLGAAFLLSVCPGAIEQLENPTELDGIAAEAGAIWSEHSPSKHKAPQLYRPLTTDQLWWCTPAMPALERQKKQVYKVTLGYVASLRSPT